MDALAQTMSPHDQWECLLSISPQRVLENNRVQLEVTLSYPGASPNAIPYASFRYEYGSKDPRIHEAIREALAYRSGLEGAQAPPSALQTTDQHIISFTTPPLPEGRYEITVTVTRPEESRVGPPFPRDGLTASASLIVSPRQIQAAVTLQRSGTFPTKDQALWVAIRNRTSALDFTRYQRFINRLFGTGEASLDVNQLGTLLPTLGRAQAEPQLSIYGPYAYALLKLATQVFLTLECGVVIRNRDRDGYTLFDLDDERIRLEDPSVTFEDLKRRLGQYLTPFDAQQVLPYLDRIVQALVGLDPERSQEVLPYCYGILQHRLTCPSLLELLWSYWHEEGMLVQTMNAIAFRFQNRRRAPRDPLGELELDPLRPLNNLIWGLIQDEHNRLTVSRRAYEYDHHYGLHLIGKAVPNLASADSRSQFLEAFHNLLYRTAMFYQEDANTTVIADGFPLLNALKEVHLLLAEGAHNQFGDLPWTARAEMLSMQWLLARPEMREFLRGRYMVPYQEPWMGAVDSMKKLQGWTDTTVTHFHELAVTGERILLSIRYGDWVDIENTQEQARNWARYWKPEIQRYIHGYQAVTGVDLMADIMDSREAAQRLQQPSRLLQRRRSARPAPRALPAARVAGALPAAGPGSTAFPMPRRGRLLRQGDDQ
jgi:hypothetical protein